MHLDLTKLFVVDIEATCWETGRGPHGFNETIELGIALLDLQKLEVERLESVMVKPTVTEVTPFCTKLTSITPEMVVNSESYVNMCKRLPKEIKSLKYPWASWGDFDRKQLERQSQREKVSFPFAGKHLNLRLLFSIAYNLPEEYGMDRALQHLGLPLEGTHHRGVDDAKNIAKLAIALFKRQRELRVESKQVSSSSAIQAGSTSPAST